MQDYFKIGEISKLYGIGVDSLRYYEEIGLLQPERSESGYRHYSVQDIWKLNIIRDLRALGFTMEQIRTYLSHHNVESTLELLRQEQKAIEEKIWYLQKLQENVGHRINIIRSGESRPMGEFSLVEIPERHCYSIPEGYSDESHMDVLIKRLMNMDKAHLYVIGSNQIGTVISMEETRKTGQIRYKSVFVVDEQGKKVLPGGTYLSVSYRGDYSQSLFWAEKTLEYASSHGLKLKGDMLEILWIDIHTSANVEEHVTELQILTEEI